MVESRTLYLYLDLYLDLTHTTNPIGLMPSLTTACDAGVFESIPACLKPTQSVDGEQLAWQVALMAMAIGRFGFHRVLCTLSSFLPPQDFCECVLIWKVDILGQLLGRGGDFALGWLRHIGQVMEWRIWSDSSIIINIVILWQSKIWNHCMYAKYRRLVSSGSSLCFGAEQARSFPLPPRVFRVPSGLLDSELYGNRVLLP